MQTMITFFYSFSAILAVVALILLVWFLHNCLLRFKKDPETNEPLRSSKRVKDSFLFLLTLVFFFAGLAMFNFSLFLQTFQIFAVGDPIAKITVSPGKEEKSFEWKIEPIGKDSFSTDGKNILTCTLTGNKWLLEGNIIRFHDYLNYVGFKPVYQLTRIQGSYFSIEEEKKNPRSILSLVDSSSEEWWRWMYSKGGKLPLVKMTFGSAVSQNAEAKTWLVKVLPAGFTLEEAPTVNSGGGNPAVAQ